MKANFNKQLENVLKEWANLAVANIFDTNYIGPEDDTRDISNAANYYPTSKDFSTGGPVFTNPYGDKSPTRRIPLTKWNIPVVLELIRWAVENAGWEWDQQEFHNFWVFKTRDNLTDLLLP